MRKLFIVTCLCVYLSSVFMDTSFLGYTLDSPIWTRLSYMFTHQGIFHLLMSLLSFYLLFGSLTRMNFIHSKLLFTATIAGSFLATYGSEMPLPTIGASGVVYFLVGAFIIKDVKDWLNNLDRFISNLLLLLIFVALNIVAAVYTNTNAIVHGIAFIYGAAFMGIYKIIKLYEQKRQEKRSKAPAK